MPSHLDSWPGEWALTGAQPVELRRGEASSIRILLAQAGHRLKTDLVNDGRSVKVTYLDSCGALIRELGVFDFQDPSCLLIRGDVLFEGFECCLQLTLTPFKGRPNLVTGILCPLGLAHGGEGGAVGSFTAEAQGGLGGGPGE